MGQNKQFTFQFFNLLISYANFVFESNSKVTQRCLGLVLDSLRDWDAYSINTIEQTSEQQFKEAINTE